MDIVMDNSAQGHIDLAVNGLLKDIAAKVASDAQRYAPRRTGHLEESIQIVPVDNDTIAVVDTASYAADVELGTRHMAAEPYLRPALYQQRGA